MRELNEFTDWAQNIISEAITEKKADSIERALPVEKNIMYQAQRKYSDRSPEQALNLFLADKLDDFDRRDLDQNKVINAQRQENTKLRQEVGTLGQELENLQAHSQESDAELERLRQLSGGLKTDIEKRRIGSQEVQELLSQIEAIKSKSGMDPEAYSKLKAEVEKQIDDFTKKGVDPEKFAELQQNLNNISRATKISNDDIERVQSLLQQVQAGQAGIEAGKTDVAARLKDLEQKQSEIEQREKNIDKEIDKKVVDAAVRAGRRGTQAQYKISKQRLDKLEDEIIPQMIKSNLEKNAKQDADIEEIRHHDEVQDVEIASLSGKKPQELKNVVKPEAQDELQSHAQALLTRLQQKRLPLPEPNGNDNGQEKQPELDLEPEEMPQEPQDKRGLNVVPMQTNESIMSEVTGMDPDEENREKQRIAAHYAGIYAPLYYQLFEREPDKRRIMRRYARDDVIDALYYSIYNWLFRIGRYAVEDENRLWRTALEILVAQHPYIEYDDLGLDPNKIRNTQRIYQPPPRQPDIADLSPKQPPAAKQTKPEEPGSEGVKESKLPRRLSQQIDSLAENILGEQYSKYLR